VQQPKNSMEVRRSNLRLLLMTIRNNDRISKRELERLTGLSWGTISFLVSDLIKNGYIVPVGKQSTQSGRWPDTFSINSDNYYVVGLFISMNSIDAMVTDLKGSILKEWKRFLVRQEYSCIMDTLLSFLDEIILETYADKEIVSIGIAIQGTVDTKNGISVYFSPFQNWENVPLKDIIENRYHIPTVIMHDPNCLMAAEQVKGELYKKDIKNAVMISTDGLGISLMLNGQLYLGSHNAAGEFGHVPIVENGAVCPAGHRGCLLEYATAAGIMRRLLEEVNQGTTTSVDMNNLNFKAMISAAENGDKLCLRLFHRLGEYLGIGISGFANVMDPEIVILHGDLVPAAHLFLKPLQDKLDAHLYRDTPIKLLLSKTGDNATVFGAAITASEFWIRQLEVPAKNSIQNDAVDSGKAIELI